MTHVGEKLVIMDSGTTTFRNQKRISLSKNFALFLIFIFLCCIVGTGLLVYHFSSCSTSAVKAVDDGAVRDSCNAPSTDDKVISITENTQDNSVTTEVSTTIATSEDNKTGAVDFRLSTKVIPHSYKLKLIPFIYTGNFTFHGEVTILVNITENVDSITLHADELEIENDSVQVYAEGGDYYEVVISELTNNSKSDFLTLKLEEELQEGKQYNIFIKFKGVLNDMMEGFYRSSYQDKNNTR